MRFDDFDPRKDKLEEAEPALKVQPGSPNWNVNIPPANDNVKPGEVIDMKKAREKLRGVDADTIKDAQKIIKSKPKSFWSKLSAWGARTAGRHAVGSAASGLTGPAAPVVALLTNIALIGYDIYDLATNWDSPLETKVDPGNELSTKEMQKGLESDGITVSVESIPSFDSYNDYLNNGKDLKDGDQVYINDNGKIKHMEVTPGGLSIVVGGAEPLPLDDPPAPEPETKPETKPDDKPANDPGQDPDKPNVVPFKPPAKPPVTPDNVPQRVKPNEKPDEPANDPEPVEKPEKPIEKPKPDDKPAPKEKPAGRPSWWPDWLPHWTDPKTPADPKKKPPEEKPTEKPKPQDKPQPSTKPNTKPQPSTKPNTKPQPNTKPNAEPEASPLPNVQPGLAPRPQQQTNPQINPRLNPRLAPRTQPQTPRPQRILPRPIVPPVMFPNVPFPKDGKGVDDIIYKGKEAPKKLSTFKARGDRKIKTDKGTKAGGIDYKKELARIEKMLNNGK